jgi:hypothetical protein
VGGEAAIAVIAGHELAAADGWPASKARRTFAAGNHRGNDHGLVQPTCDVVPGGNHATGDLVAQHQRKRVARGYTIISKTDIGMADAAARYFHDHFVRAGLEGGKLSEMERFADSRESVTKCTLNSHLLSSIPGGQTAQPEQRRPERAHVFAIVRYFYFDAELVAQGFNHPVLVGDAADECKPLAKTYALEKRPGAFRKRIVNAAENVFHAYAAAHMVDNFAFREHRAHTADRLGMSGFHGKIAHLLKWYFEILGRASDKHS